MRREKEVPYPYHKCSVHNRLCWSVRDFLARHDHVII